MDAAGGPDLSTAPSLHSLCDQSLNDLTQLLRERALDSGFNLFGIAPAVASAGFHQLTDWIDAGYSAGMDYIPQRIEAYKHPAGVLPGVQSIIALAFPYDRMPKQQVDAGRGRVARYAWSGSDYHDIIHPKLKLLCRLIGEAVPGSSSRGVVDTAPLMEREIASLAGLGWRGKNTLLLNRFEGSYFFLACVLTSVELPSSEPHESSHCGTCTACLDACPTDAFPKPGVLDANRCISFLTIENRDSIQTELRSGIGDWVFGCDICQEVCPWNRKPARSPAQTVMPQDGEDFRDLVLNDLFTMSDESFRKRFRKTPFWRTRRRGMLRNAAIVLGNQTPVSSFSVLAAALADADAIVRQSVAWAIGQFGLQEQHRAAASAALATALARELDESVRSEIRIAQQRLE